MPQEAAELSLPEAFEVIKEMQLRSWQPMDEAYQAARRALAETLQHAMDDYLSSWLDEARRRGIADRRNGHYERSLLTELGEVLVQVPRTRTRSAVAVLRAYAQRTERLERLILACFMLGLSTRKVGEALRHVLGYRVSASTVSRVAKRLDEQVAAFHRRRLHGELYRALVFDGVVLSRKSGAGALKRPVLVALGIRHDGRKEVLDFRLARSESEAEWERFLTDLQQRGLHSERIELLCVDGGRGLLKALPTVYPQLPVQRCWAHKVRNLTDKVRKKDREPLKVDLRRIYNAPNRRAAQSAAARFARRWQQQYPAVVDSLREDLEELLAFFRFEEEPWRRWTPTTNAIERRFREVKRRTRPMGVFQDRTSMERVLFAVSLHENKNQGIPPLSLLTQNS